MQKEHYIGYIAHFVKNIDQLPSVDNYREFFSDTLGTTNVLAAPESKIKDVARWMYRAHVASLYIRYSPFYLLSTLSSKQIEQLISNVITTVDEFGLYKPIDEDVSISNVDRHIKKDALDTYKSVLNKYSAPTTIKSSKKIIVTKLATTGRKTAAKGKKSVASKKSVPKGKKCSDYKLSELKEMAKTKKIVGYSKMNKAALCTALGIKE